MKKAILLVVVVAVLFVFTGCEQDSTFTIEVSGTADLKFSGSYLVITADGTSTSRSVDGTVPQTYTVTGTMVSVSFQKRTEGGLLQVRILKDGRAVASESTTAAYGVVSVAA